MTDPSTTLDPKRQERAREYARIRRHLWIAQVVLGVLYLTLWIVSGSSSAFQGSLRLIQEGGLIPTALPWWASLILTAAALALPWALFTTPFNFYSGFILPHRFGLSNQTLAGWIFDTLKGGLISTVLGVPLLVALYAAIRAFPDTWWFWAAAGYSLVTVVLTTLAPVVLMPLFYKFNPLEDERKDLVERLVSLAEQAGTQVEGVYSFDMSRRTRTANAALVGMGKTRRILLGDTLLEEFSSKEIETILAHELAHHVHHDIPLGLLFGTVLQFVTFYLAAQGLQLAANRLPLLDLSDPAGLPFLTLLFGIAGFISMPIGNTYSRWREGLADDYALEATEKPHRFADAFARLANQNLADADPSRWVRWLLASHPPLKDRIAKAERFFEIGTEKTT
jgi:STE24 endopeptidase